MPLAAEHADALRMEVASVETCHLLLVGTIGGVAPLAAAARNGPGAGRIESFGAGGTLIAWKAPGSSTFGTPVDCRVRDDYLLEDGEDLSKWIRIRVYPSQLVPGPASARVYLRDVYNNDVGSDDVTAAEAAAGDVETYTIDVQNAGPVAMISGITVWLDAAVADLEISDDGVVWVSPTTEAAGLEFADLAAGASHTLHLRRTIAAEAGPDPDVLNHLHVSFFGI